ncbi:MAG: ornithine cyclodeaminase family protein [Chloroflexi bacterium]|nr:ornithine cyclodeaminase family protein [Chloroflexota bacterium]
MMILTANDVCKALPMKETIEAMKHAYAALTGGKAEVPLRTRLPVPPQEGVSLIMPAFIQADEEALAIKVVSVFPKNLEQGLPIINAVVLVLDAQTGVPRAILEGGALTAIRTGAASGAATELLSRPDSKTAAIFGAGVQGRTQLEAVCTVRSIETAWVYDLDTEQVSTFIEEIAGRGPIPDDLRAGRTPEEAIAEADIICTATTSSTPVFPDEAIKAGAHINGVGSYTLEMIEIPPETVGRAIVYVDSRQAVLAEAGEVVAAITARLISAGELIELGSLVNGDVSGRTDDEQITFFKSVGVAVQDAMAARLAMHNASEMGLGQRVEW